MGNFFFERMASAATFLAQQLLLEQQQAELRNYFTWFRLTAYH
jgi:hypothetical protein